MTRHEARNFERRRSASRTRPDAMRASAPMILSATMALVGAMALTTAMALLAAAALMPIGQSAWAASDTDHAIASETESADAAEGRADEAETKRGADAVDRSSHDRALVRRASASGAESTTAPHRLRPEHDLRTYGIVDAVAGMDGVRVRRNMTYKTVAGQDLTMDVYSPPAGLAPASAGPRPAVVFVNGVGDWPGSSKVKEWGQYTSWPRFVAASGYAAVTFDARGTEEGRNAEDVRDAFAFLRERGADLGIDGSRLAAWACSATVGSALTYLMAPSVPGVKAAVLYYGASEVPSLRADLPVLLVRAGKDRPQMNEQLDRLAAAAAAANAPWTVVNLPSAHHAFDLLDDTAESRLAIRRTLSFLRDALEPPPAPPHPPVEARAALTHFFAGEWAEAETAYAAYAAKHPDDADAWTLLGNARIELKKPDEAAESLRRAIEVDPGIGEAWAMLGRIEAERKNVEEAERLLRRAIAIMPEDGESRYQLGKVYLAQHRNEAAVESLEQAVRLAPGNGWAWNSLAYAYLAVKRYDKAASSFERVLPFAQNNPTLLYNAACAHSLSGNKDRALELLGRAVENGFKDKAGMSSDPDLGGVREDQRFQELLKRLG